MSAADIRGQIKSIQSTQKTTRAMEMVAASKMKKAEDRMKRSRPYAEKILAVTSRMACSNPDYKHEYMQERDIKRVGYIVVSSDRGLCGGLNVNMFKHLLKDIKKWQEQKVGIDLCLIGRKAEQFFRRTGGNVLGSASQLGDTPELTDLIGIVQVMFKAYEEGKIDALYIVYNQFVSAMTQTPTITQLIPVKQTEDESVRGKDWDYLYEPSSEELLDQFIKRFIESQVYQAVTENIACQQAATMVAMKAASDNAGEIIKELQLVYNKARQAAITQEISEIVGGAEAIQ